MKKEQYIGIIGLVALVGFVWTYTAIKRSGVLAKKFSIYATFDRSFFLKAKDYIYVQGYHVGYVQAITIDKTSGKIVAELGLFDVPKLPKDSLRAVITYTSILGGRQVNLVYPRPCSAQGISCLQNGDTIPGEVLDMGVQAANATKTIRPKLDTALADLTNERKWRETIRQARASIANLERSTAKANLALSKNGGGIRNTARDIARTSESLKKNIPNYTAQLDSIQVLLATLREKDASKLLVSTRNQLDTVNGYLKNIRTNYLPKAESVLESTQQTLRKLPQNPTLQKWVYADSNAQKLGTRVDTLQAKLREVYTYPEKYRKF